MPFMDGYDATQAIRDYLHQKNIEQPIITAVTGHVDDCAVKKGLACGMNQVVSKPINLEVMRNLLYQTFYLSRPGK
jgi:CheY-like chemotaxis protein